MATEAPAPLPIRKTDDGMYVFSCPHCRGTIMVSPAEVACKIFRHAVMKETGAPINPHTTQEECERLVATDAVRGCAKPFRFDGETVDVCGYV